MRLPRLAMWRWRRCLRRRRRADLRWRRMRRRLLLLRRRLRNNLTREQKAKSKTPARRPSNSLRASRRYVDLSFNFPGVAGAEELREIAFALARLNFLKLRV